MSLLMTLSGRRKPDLEDRGDDSSVGLSKWRLDYVGVDVSVGRCSSSEWYSRQ